MQTSVTKTQRVQPHRMSWDIYGKPGQSTARAIHLQAELTAARSGSGYAPLAEQIRLSTVLTSPVLQDTSLSVKRRGMEAHAFRRPSRTVTILRQSWCSTAQRIEQRVRFCAAVRNSEQNGLISCHVTREASDDFSLFRPFPLSLLFSRVLSHVFCTILLHFTVL